MPYKYCMSSPVHLSGTFVHPTQAIEIFYNVSTPFGTMAICWHPGKIFTERELTTRGVAEYCDFRPIERYMSETVQDRS